MKKITAFAAATALTASMATGAFAAGPTVVQEEPEPVVLPAESPSTSLGAGPIAAGVLGLAAVAAIAGASDDDDDEGGGGTTTSTPVTN